jgi:RNA polymerase sigma factor (sigma-70 family)
MKRDEKLTNDRAFHTTQWTLVVLPAAHNQGQVGRNALEQLCRIYWWPLRAFARWKGYSLEDSEDLTQGFFEHLLSHQALTHVDRQEGKKFRSYLLACFRHYLSDQLRHRLCQKVGGDSPHISIDQKGAESRCRLEPADHLSPDKIFAAHWAMALLDHSLTRLGGEWQSRGRKAEFETLKEFVGIEGRRASYAEASKALNVGLEAVRSAIRRLRERYQEIVREEVSRTVSDPADIDHELHALYEALMTAGGRIDEESPSS